MKKEIKSVDDAFEYAYQELCDIKVAKMKKKREKLDKADELINQMDKLQAQAKFLIDEANELNAEIDRYSKILDSVKEFDLPF